MECEVMWWKIWKVAYLVLRAIYSGAVIYWAWRMALWLQSHGCC
jgi:hypothetical protein